MELIDLDKLKKAIEDSKADLVKMTTIKEQLMLEINNTYNAKTMEEAVETLTKLKNHLLEKEAKIVELTNMINGVMNDSHN